MRPQIEDMSGRGAGEKQVACLQLYREMLIQSSSSFVGATKSADVEIVLPAIYWSA